MSPGLKAIKVLLESQEPLVRLGQPEPQVRKDLQVLKVSRV